MKKNIKKIIPMVALATLMTTTVFASNTKDETVTVVAQQQKQENQIFVNGEILQDANIIKENNKTLIPARAIFEKMGYKVSYEPQTKIITMVNGASYITFSTTNDAYTFARMAPQPLGMPVVKEGVTYVPVELFDLIGMEYKLTEQNVLYVGNNEEDFRQKQIIITNISEDENQITVNDPEKGEVILNVKDLEIKFDTDIKQLMVGQALQVEYGDIMTSSQPPINVPKSVTVVNKLSYGTVLNVEKDEQNNTKVLFNDEQIGEVMLVLAPDFKVEFKTDDKQLEKGQTLEVVLPDAMTMSIPPMGNPKSVVVVKSASNENTEDVKEETENTIKSNATIKSVDKENNKILVTDEKLGDVVLNLHDDVIIENKNGEALTQDSLTKQGQKLEVEYSPIMTRSIPPINNPVKIVVLN